MNHKKTLLKSFGLNSPHSQLNLSFTTILQLYIVFMGRASANVIVERKQANFCIVN